MRQSLRQLNEWEICGFFSLSQFLLQSTADRDVEAYLYEAKCQLLMYSAIAMIKLNMIVSEHKPNQSLFGIERPSRDVDRHTMRRWLVQPSVRYSFIKVNPTKILR